MRLVIAGIFVTGLAGIAQTVTAQADPKPQVSPAPPPPIFTAIPAPPPPPRSPKERSATPKGNPGTWVTNDDYPPESVRNNEQGTTGFRLTIGPDGLVTTCDITLSSGFAQLDQTACGLMTQRGQFNPALDRKGKPTTSTWASRFRWVLPEPKISPAPQPFVETMSFTVEPDGSASDCTKTGGGSPIAGETGPCGFGQVFEPYRDATGNAIRRRVTLMISLTVTNPDAPPVIAAPPPPPPPPKRRKP